MNSILHLRHTHVYNYELLMGLAVESLELCGRVSQDQLTVFRYIIYINLGQWLSVGVSSHGKERILHVPRDKPWRGPPKLLASLAWPDSRESGHARLAFSRPNLLSIITACIVTVTQYTERIQEMYLDISWLSYIKTKGIDSCI